MKSIRSKLVKSTLAITTSIILFLTLGSLFSHKSVIDRCYDSMLCPLANRSARVIDNNYENVTGTILWIPYYERIKSAETVDTEIEILNNIIGSNAIYYQYGYFSKDLKPLYTTDESAKEYINDACVSECLETNQRAYSLPKVASDGTEYMLICVSINDTNDNLKSILVVAINYEFFNTMASEMGFSEKSTSYVISKEGITITNEDISKIDTSINPIELAKTDSKYKNIAKIHSEAIKGEDGYIMFDDNGTSSLATYSKIASNDTYLIITAPVTDFIDWNSFIFRCIFLAVILLMISFFIIFVLANKISLPIINVSKRLKLLAKGNLTQPVEVINSTKELYELSSSLEETINSLNMYINKITERLTSISNGDLVDKMDGNFNGDFSLIKTTFNSIILSLNDAFSKINSTSEEVNTGAIQVSNGAQILSDGTTQQASAIEELLASINDVSEQISSNAKSAQSAKEIVESNADSMITCNNEMKNMLNAMDEINISSNEISKIIKVIDDIAFQTNILALNAAVEAARAGIAGKGFAVVADEVRALAAKSAEAANQTTSLIKGSIERVNKGTEIAQQTATALNDIVEKTNDINTLVKNISTSSEQQTNNIVQINSGIEQISGVVQTNTATAEESAAASHELLSQSYLLKNLISKFQLDNNSSKKTNDIKL